MARLRLAAERQFGEDRAVARERLVQVAVLLGINDVDTTGDDRDRAARQGPQMRRRVDAAGQPRDHDDASLAQPGGEVAGDAAAVGRGVARANYRDHRGEHQPAEHFRAAEHGQQRRRILDRGESARIERLAPADDAAAKPFDRHQFHLGVAAGRRGNRPCPIGFREARQRIERGSGRAEAAQQRKEGDRPDGFAAAQAQPVEAFLRFEFARGHLPIWKWSQPFPKEIGLSVPASSRWTFCRWRRTTRIAMRAISAARGWSTTKLAVPALATAATRAASEE